MSCKAASHMCMHEAGLLPWQIMDQLAQEYGFQYHVMTAGIDEKAIRSRNPHDLVLALGRAKRDAILAQMRAAEAGTTATSVQGNGGSGDSSGSPGPLLLTCDQVVVHEGRILEKPENDAECREWIR